MKAPRDRSLLQAVGRGFLGRCPSCGKGAVLAGYIKPAPRCLACGENLAPYQTADFAPYLVTFAIGLVFMPLIIVMALRDPQSAWILYALMAAALTSALVLLPRAKGAVIGVLWALDVGTP
jgi:uncharacterized protein (DUF983 family)